MNKFYVLVALGPNSINVPGMVFGTKEAAVAWMVDATGGRQPEIGRVTGNPYWRTDENDAVHQKVFLSYYNGCGGIGGYNVVEVTEGTPFVGFDLD
jgi:hypothetical protein